MKEAKCQIFDQSNMQLHLWITNKRAIHVGKKNNCVFFLRVAAMNKI